ncbi:MAG: glycerol kinase GlpK [Alphaproteobacteria bacterium]|nr:glycerol kinase GlpK [Alphaproteobacteria bacterium]
MSPPSHLLAIDQGTTSTRAILFDAVGMVHHVARRELRQYYPQPGWVEHDPEEIWDAVVATCREAIGAAQSRPVAAIGITNQRETTVLWERSTGRPVRSAIVWQDRRTVPQCAAWRRDGLTELVASRTGLVIDPYFSASKIAWLLDNTDGLRTRAERGEIAFGTIDSFLLWRLSGGALHVTDVTNAARTMLFDLRRLAWDDDLLAACRIPRALLPEVRDTDGDFGTVATGILGDAIPVAGVAGDQQAATIGQACFRPGMIKSTYGTGAFALLHTGAEPAASRHRLLSTIAYRLRGETAYALEGSIFIAGAAVQWLRDRLHAVEAASETQGLAERADPRQRVYFVPAFAGLGAPYWEPETRGALTGLTAECGLPEIARATLEAIGFQTRDLIAAMTADGGVAIERLRVDGGLAANDWAMQFLADILPAQVERPAKLETTAWGAAYVAGLARGLCPEPEAMMAGWNGERVFRPAMPAAERDERYAGWQRAVAGVLAAATS